MMRYKLLGRSGLRVSEICLGAMTFGEEWGWGSSEEESLGIFKAFADAGGNFVDTADKYTEGTSEKMVGRFIKGDRERWVIATKFTCCMRPGDPNGGGNHRKNMFQAVDASLRRLDTDYIDLYWLHAWDGTTPIEEVMQTFHVLIQSGKVLYAGISNAPAWVIARANTIAELRGWPRFVGLQMEYSLAERTGERELIPMANALEIGIAAWSPLASGLLTGKYIGKPPGKEAVGRRLDKFAVPLATERKDQIARAVVEIAKDLGKTPAQVGLNWVRQYNNAIPIIGARKMDQFEDNMACLEWTLSSEHLARLDEISRIEAGYPHDFLARPSMHKNIFGGTRELIDMPTSVS